MVDAPVLDVISSECNIILLVSFLQNLADAMKIICSILTKDPNGGPDRIPFDTFKTLYYYLAGLSGDISLEHIEEVFAYLEDDV